MIILFGSIATIGFKTYVKNNVDFSDTKTLFIASVMIVFGLGNVSVWKFSGVGLSALIGLGLQIIFLLYNNYTNNNK